MEDRPRLRGEDGAIARADATADDAVIIPDLEFLFGLSNEDMKFV